MSFPRGRVVERWKRSVSRLLFGLVILGCLSVGWGMAQVWAVDRPVGPVAEMWASGGVDVVPERYQLGQELYLENCASCHIGVPPAVLPTQTWQALLQDSQHYGLELKKLVDPPRLLVWNYLQLFSRPVNANETVPFRVTQSRYFKVLHPRVPISPELRLVGCISCHPAAAEFEFRQLTPEWETAP